MMNKYQEALNTLYYLSCDYCEFDYMKSDGLLSDDELDDIYKNKVEPSWQCLIELIEKATPKKAKGISITHEGRVGNCPSCNRFVRKVDIKPNICECGQALDWSDEE